MKKNLLILSLAFMMTTTLGVVSCNNNPDSGETYTGDYKVKLTALSSTTIKASKTVQLRSSVTGATVKDVTFTSSNEAVATVSAKGLVTGISAGTATIRCSLDIEPKCYAEIVITVEAASVPTSIAITGAEAGTQWVGESVQLAPSVTPEDASSSVVWETSDDSVATVDDTGKVTFIATGSVTIICASKEDANVGANISFNVKSGVFRSDLGSPYWDISSQCADNDPHVTLNIDESQTGYHSCYFANVKSTKYYVEGYFQIKSQISTWAWQGIGFGSGLSETSTRYFIFSPRVDGQGNTFNKFIVKDLPNESWPAITTRSQTWGENGLNNIDWEHSKVKVGLLRDENTYYYLINDKLMYVDETTLYDGVPTMPIMVSVDLPVTVTDYSVTTDEAKISEVLARDEFKDSFYSANPELVDYESDSSFIFKSNSILCKDNKVKSLGDKAKLVGAFTVEFDMEDILCNKGHTNSMAGLTLNLQRYDSADTIESLVIGKSTEQELEGYNPRFLSWAYPMSMENKSAPYYWLESSSTVLEDLTQTHHVKMTRTIADNIATFEVYIDGNKVEFDKKSSKYSDMTSKYTGAYLIFVGGEYASGHVMNFKFSSNK